MQRWRWPAMLALLVAVPWGIYQLLARATEVEPSRNTPLLLPGLSLALVVLTLGLAGVLIRNLVKLLLERKRGILGSNLRIKLVFFYLALVLLPALVLFTGSAKVIKDTVEAILRDPLEQLKRGQEVVDDWTAHFEADAVYRANHVVRSLGRQPAVDPAEQSARIDEYRSEPGVLAVELIEDGQTRARSYNATASAAALTEALGDVAARATASGREQGASRRIDGRIVVLGAAVDRETGRVAAVAVEVPRSVAESMERISGANQAYQKFKADRRDLIRFYLTLIGLIFIATLFVATWLGLYVARRITVPLQQVAAAAGEISIGNLDVRVRTRVGDEMGMLVDAFNDMAAELQENRRVITRSTAELRRSNRALDERRRYIETLVANLSTAVISLDAAGRVSTTNPAVEKILGLRLTIGDELAQRLSEAGLGPLVDLLALPTPGDGTLRRDVELPEGSPTAHVSVQVSGLEARFGESPGTLIMVEDLTDLLQAQRALAWQEVARRIAHEIKNPLTPIQLAAQRLRRKLDTGAADLNQVLIESTESIEHEVQGLKQLVDEFSRYARMPETVPRWVELHDVVRSVLALYQSLPDIVWDVDLDPGIERVQLDPLQIRRVLINLIDNAISATDRVGRIRISTRRVSERGALRIEVSDDGPGVPAGDRDAMFVPYFSTKRRGSGLGLAIVHKVVTDHQGTIRIEDNEPRGARFVIEIPA